jgi:hypothetical protein
MIDFNAHFDGHVIVPEQAVDLPQNRSFTVHVEEFGRTVAAVKDPPQSALIWLAENAVDDELPADLSAQHDHYLYGAPRRGRFRLPVYSPTPRFGLLCSGAVTSTIARLVPGSTISFGPGLF